MSASTEAFAQVGPAVTCPPWCVECWELSGDLPGSRDHHGQHSEPVPALVELAGADDYVTVQVSFCHLHPLLHGQHHDDDGARVDLYMGKDWDVASLLPVDARRLAHELITAADPIDASPGTDDPVP